MYTVEKILKKVPFWLSRGLFRRADRPRSCILLNGMATVMKKILGSLRRIWRLCLRWSKNLKSCWLRNQGMWDIVKVSIEGRNKKERRSRVEVEISTPSKVTARARGGFIKIMEIKWRRFRKHLLGALKLPLKVNLKKMMVYHYGIRESHLAEKSRVKLQSNQQPRKYRLLKYKIPHHWLSRV